MDVVTAMMFGVMAIIFEQILVMFAQDVQSFPQNWRHVFEWKWDD